MSCANKMHPSRVHHAGPRALRWCRPVFMKAIIAITEAFKEALDMRRQRTEAIFLNDE